MHTGLRFTSPRRSGGEGLSAFSVERRFDGLGHAGAQLGPPNLALQRDHPTDAWNSSVSQAVSQAGTCRERERELSRLGQSKVGQDLQMVG